MGEFKWVHGGEQNKNKESNFSRMLDILKRLKQSKRAEFIKNIGEMRLSKACDKIGEKIHGE